MSSLLSPVFSVRRQAPKLIGSALQQSPRHLKYLSDLDDHCREQNDVIFFYKNKPSMKGKDPVSVISEALARALVYYYPLAGRIREGPNEKLMVDCTDEGILFVEAEANITLEQLGDSIYQPYEYLDEFLYKVPGSEGVLNCPVLLVQVTRLICGGFIVAIMANHVMSDGLGFGQFMQAVIEIACGKQSPSILPIWNRELFNARDPPRITQTILKHEEVTHSHNFTDIESTYNMSLKSFFFGPEEFKALRNHLPAHLKNHITRFILLTACLWKCRTAALGLKPDDVVRLACACSVRGKFQNMQVPLGYYGNTCVLSVVSSMVNHLCDNPLAYAVELVMEALAQISEEYVKSMIDYFAINKGRPLPYTIKDFYVSDNTHIGFDKVDFGWGKPVYGGHLGASTVRSCFNRCNKKGEEGVLVLVCLPSSAMERFGQEVKIVTRSGINTEL
ncbi:Transferase domain-containing protein [Cephalotus follicularis]|uniref:Transferase domain-containing protein n=1 Tax=Cephalotus follicularis TaxID=3775 RepID=A0A1Q3D9U9_CEPFO|nr:Transferase domain-containing protein [Cephalotus follicularis]